MSECKKCGTRQDLVKYGYRKVTDGNVQRYICKKCAKKSLINKLKCHNCGEKINISDTGKLSKVHRVPIYKCAVCNSEFTTSTKNVRAIVKNEEVEIKKQEHLSVLWLQVNKSIKANLDASIESQWGWG